MWFNSNPDIMQQCTRMCEYCFVNMSHHLRGIDALGLFLARISTETNFVTSILLLYKRNPSRGNSRPIQLFHIGKGAKTFLRELPPVQMYPFGRNLCLMSETSFVAHAWRNRGDAWRIWVRAALRLCLDSTWSSRSPKNSGQRLDMINLLLTRM